MTTKETMAPLDFYYKEYDILRRELNDIKNAQLSLVKFSVTATGILFGIAGREALNLPFSVVCLFPLIILIPFWHIFFDKATTVTRIVGYLRVLEKIIINPNLIKNTIGWENALVIFREIQQQQNNDFSIKRCFKPFMHLTSARYWGLYYLIFFSLSWLCILLSLFYSFTQPIKGSIFLFIIDLILGLAVYLSSSWILGVLCQLLWGKYSYGANESLWKKIILRAMILDRERLVDRLVEYEGKEWRSKALNFEGAEDFSDYDTLVIKANIKGAQAHAHNIKIQLLDSIQSELVNTDRGLYYEKYLLLREPNIAEMQIPLIRFKDVNLKEIKRLAIHYGMEVFGENINSASADNVKINIEEIELR